MHRWLEILKVMLLPVVAMLVIVVMVVMAVVVVIIVVVVVMRMMLFVVVVVVGVALSSESEDIGTYPLEFFEPVFGCGFCFERVTCEIHIRTK